MVYFCVGLSATQRAGNPKRSHSRSFHNKPIPNRYDVQVMYMHTSIKCGEKLKCYTILPFRIL